jgi:uncharacterized membrane protein YfcA
MHILLAGLIGMVSGVTSGLFGVGGGVVMVPAMVMLLKLDAKAAVATSLMVIIPTALAGSILNHSFGRIDWRTAAALIPLAIIGALVGTHFKESMDSEILKRVFGAFIMLMGAQMLFFK